MTRAPMRGLAAAMRSACSMASGVSIMHQIVVVSGASATSMIESTSRM